MLQDKEHKKMEEETVDLRLPSEKGELVHGGESMQDQTSDETSEKENLNDASNETAAGDEEVKEAMKVLRKFADDDEDDDIDISLKSILGGDILTSKFVVKQVMFIMFIVFLLLCYTGNRYDSQQDVILIDSLRNKLQEVKYNVLTQSSELMNVTRQSSVEKALRNTTDSGLHNPDTPPYLIKGDGESDKSEEE